jgi:hypothetical protein
MDKVVNAKIATMIRSRLLDALSNNYRTGFAVNHLGCSIKSLRAHLESLFQPGMTWTNQGQWHIDHIVPLSHFNLADRKELKRACHYTNLQPLWAWQNWKKNNRYETVISIGLVGT